MGDARSTSPNDGLVELSPDAVVVDREGRLVFANRAAAGLFGASSSDELVGRAWADLISPEFHDWVRARRATLLDGARHTDRLDIRIRRLDGSACDVEAAAAALEFGGGPAVEVVFRDITARKQAERIAGCHNEIVAGMGRIFESALTCETEEDLGRVCLEVAEQVTQSKLGFLGEIDPVGNRLHGIAISDSGWDACRMRDPSGHGERDVPGAFAIRGIYGRVLTDGRSVVTNDPRSHPDSIGLPPGHPTLEAFLGVPLTQSDRTWGLLAVGNREGGYGPQEVAAAEALAPAVLEAFMRKRAENELRRQEQKYRSLFETSMDAVYVTRDDGAVVDANPAACRMHGMTVEEIRRRGRAGLVVSDERLAAAMRRRATSGAAKAELTMLRADGTEFPAEVEAVVVDPARADWTTFVIARDIGERKRAERALRDEEKVLQRTVQRFYSVLSSMYSALLLVAKDGRIEFANPAFCRYFGLADEPSDLVGLGADEVIAKTRHAYLHPEEAVARIADIIRRGEPVEAEEVAMRDGRTCLRDFVPLTLDGDPCGRLWIDVDITDRKHAEEALEDADRRKTEFLAVLSHELRNPLASIRNSAFVLDWAPRASDQAKRAKEIIRRQTEHLTRLVDDLLDVTRISRGKIALQRTRIDLREIVRKTTDDVRSVFAEASVELRVEHVMGPVWIDADPTRIAQVLGNLLHNSVKFTPAGGAVAVTTAAKRGWAELRVRDDGVGMEPETVERMFEPFAQAPQSPARTSGGLGLGLALVKAFVELHGGSVEARSDGIGRGAEFTVRVPLAETGGDEAGSERREITHAEPLVILVVEDNPDAAQSLADILELHGHRVRIARDGRSGLDLAHALRPDVVLCDIGLPGMDGYAIVRSLRRDDALRDTRVVAVTGYAQPEDRERARDAGFDAHITKPPDVHELMDVLARRG